MITRIRRPGQPPADIDHGPGVARPDGIRRMAGSVPAVALTEAMPSTLGDNGVAARAQRRKAVTSRGVAGRLELANHEAAAAYRRAYRARVGR